MAKLADTVNGYLKKMSEIGGTEKGSYGEKAALKICEQIYQKKGGILYHSYTYKTDPMKEGNIKRSSEGGFYIENLSSVTEIDILLVTPYRLFPIEVKAYKAKKMVLTNKTIEGVFKDDKSPVHQNEMHCRHLYPAIMPALPEGDTRYIVPIVVFVDKCDITDKRSKRQKEYIKVTVLDKLYELIEALDTPLEFKLDLEAIQSRLNEACTKSELHLKLRKLD